MKVRVLIMLAVLLGVVPAVFAQGAHWRAVPLQFSWDLSMVGACTNETQCLLHVQGNPAFDGDTDRWFRLNDPKNWPRCVNDTQSVLDYRCEQGNWSTRTKQVALSLLSFAEINSGNDFTLFCDSYDRVLNQFEYTVQSIIVEDYLGGFCALSGKPVECVNSICVLKTPNTVAIGASLNLPVNDPAKSFLKALGKPETLCNAVSGDNFASCGEGVWYSRALNAVIYLASGSVPQPVTGTAAKLSDGLQEISRYVLQVLHNPANPAMNFEYFPRLRLFNSIYLAQKSGRSVFGFLERDVRPETDPIPVDVIGVRYSGMNLGSDPCLVFVKPYDDRAFCENQTGTGFNIVARHRDTPLGESPVVEAWPALAGRLRP